MPRPSWVGAFVVLVCLTWGSKGSDYYHSYYGPVPVADDQQLRNATNFAVEKLCRELFAEFGDIALRMKQRPKEAFSPWFKWQRTISAHQQDTEEGVRYFLDVELINPLFNSDIPSKLKELGKGRILQLYSKWRKDVGVDLPEKDLDETLRSQYLVAFLMSVDPHSAKHLISNDIIGRGTKVYSLVVVQYQNNGVFGLIDHELRRVPERSPQTPSPFVINWKEIENAVDLGVFPSEEEDSGRSSFGAANQRPDKDSAEKDGATKEQSSSSHAEKYGKGEGAGKLHTRKQGSTSGDKGHKFHDEL